MNIDLLNYIQNARKSGMTDGRIKEGLLQSGWPEAEVDEALRTAPMTEVPLPRAKKMMSKPLAVILAVVVLAVAAYFGSAYYFANYQDIHFWPYEEELVVPTFTPRPATKDPTADWQTYRNEEYGFEFKYPGELILDNSRQTVNQPIYLWIPTKLGYGFELDSRPAQKDGTLNTTIAGIPAHQYSATGLDDAEMIHTSWVHGDLLYYFSILKDSQGTLDKSAKQLYDQILSTFRFLK